MLKTSCGGVKLVPILCLIVLTAWTAIAGYIQRKKDGKDREPVVSVCDVWCELCVLGIC